MITTRQTIADALSTVSGVHGYAKRPKAVKAGDAWPLVDQLTRGPGQAFETTWRIAVLIGPDEVTAIDQFDTLIPAIADALVHVAYVDLARPISIQTEAGDLFGCEVQARSE
jgi:hypothetical protein